MPSTLGLKMEIPAYFPRGWFAPEAFSEPQQLLAAFFNSSTVGLAILDRQLRFQAANGALAKMSGVPAGAHLGKTAQQIFGDLEPLEVLSNMYWQPQGLLWTWTLVDGCPNGLKWVTGSETSS